MRPDHRERLAVDTLTIRAADTPANLRCLDTLTIRAADTPANLRCHWHICGSYAETCWLPVVGPTALFAGRRLAAWLDAAQAVGEDSYDVDLVELGDMLGVKAAGPNSPMVRSLDRLVRFGLADLGPLTPTLSLRVWVPPVPERLLRRLPATVVAAARDALEAQQVPA